MNREDRWVRFACAALRASDDTEHAARVADALEGEFEERFETCPDVGENVWVRSGNEWAPATVIGASLDGESFHVQLEGLGLARRTLGKHSLDWRENKPSGRE